MNFSVCIPIYNAEKFLAKCIKSVLNQTYHFFEIILVDDGSEDNSYKICCDFSFKDSRIKCYTKKNEGQLATRFFACSKAKGDVVVFLDSDDYLETNALEVLNDYFSKYDCDCIYFGWRRFSRSHSLKIHKICQEVEVIKDNRLKYKKIFGNSNYNSMCLKAVKKIILVDKDYSNYYKLRMAEDLVQTIDVVKQSEKIIFIPEILYNYRVNPQSVTESVCIENYDVDDVSRNLVLDFLKKEDVFTKDDWVDYGTYCSSLFFNDLIKISRFPNTLKDRFFLLKKKRCSPYYIFFISRFYPKKILPKICFWLFEKKCLFAIVFIAKGLCLKNFFERTCCKTE